MCKNNTQNKLKRKKKRKRKNTKLTKTTKISAVGIIDKQLYYDLAKENVTPFSYIRKHTQNKLPIKTQLYIHS